MSTPPSRHEEGAWIGSRYAEGWNGVHLLVLGESSYGKDWARPRDLVEAHIQGSGRWRGTYTRFLKILTNTSTAPTLEQRIHYWDRLAFTNYLNSPAGLKARERPSDDKWAASITTFSNFLGNLNPTPDGVIVWGLPLWYALERNPGCRLGNPAKQCLQWDPEKKMGFIYRLDGRPIPAVAIAHPSTPISFSPKWTKRLHDFLACLRSLRPQN